MQHRPESNDLKIIYENICDFSERQMLISEQTSISYQMLAEAIKKDLSVEGSQHSLTRYRSLVAKYCDRTDVSNTVRFFIALTENISEYLPQISPSDNEYEIFDCNSSAKIAYVKNNYTDSAFLSFSALFSAPKAHYSSNFEIACEDVYNGECDYCILPIESISNGKLFSFYSLIDKYDLKIFASCDIDEKHSQNRTRYALLSRKLLVIPHDKRRSYIEFSMIDDTAKDLSDIMAASDICGLRLYRIGTSHVPYDDVAIKYYHVFETTEANLLPFLMYLDIQHPSCKIIGQYIHIN